MRKVFCQKHLYLVTLVPKTSTFYNQVQITRQEPYDWPASHRTCFWLEKQVHLVLSTLSRFQLFLANFEPIRGHTLVPRHVIIRGLIVMDWYTATRTRSRPILHVQADAACWNGMDNGRSISKYSRFQSCLYANDVATTHVVYSYYTVRYSSNTTL